MTHKWATLATAMMMLAFVTAGCGSERAPEPERKSPLSTPPAPTTGQGSAAPRPKTEPERGNTPPGQTRAGEKPAEGTIVDPSGVTKR